MSLKSLGHLAFLSYKLDVLVKLPFETTLFYLRLKYRKKRQLRCAVSSCKFDVPC